MSSGDRSRALLEGFQKNRRLSELTEHLAKLGHWEWDLTEDKATVALTILRETGDGENKKNEKFDTEVERDEIVLKETRFESHDNQRAFLNGELARLESVATDLTTVVAKNGIRMGLLESVQSRHEERVILTQRFIAEVEDVDMAEAIAGLNRDQLALQSSIGVMARIGRVSLLDFL